MKTLNDNTPDRRPYTPFEAALEYGLPVIGHLVAGALGGALLGFIGGLALALIPGALMPSAHSEALAYGLIEWCAVFGMGFGLATWNYTRRAAL